MKKEGSMYYFILQYFISSVNNNTLLRYIGALTFYSGLYKLSFKY